VKPSISPLLRRAEPEDAATIYAWRREPSATRFQPLRPLTVDQVRTQLQRRRHEPLDATLNGEVQWLILDQGSPAGWITLEVTSREHGIAAVGYTVAAAHRGRGLATAALREVVPIALDPHGVDLWRLEANVASANTASRRVLAKAGFVHEGHARGLLVIGGVRVDHERYALLRTDLAYSRRTGNHP
jgi:RimJ/RimL family protein N-acetyltransferase